MNKFLTELCLLLCLPVTHAQEWEVFNSLSISGPARKGVFHHLDAAGRQSLAISDQTLAIVWEDNHTGKPQVYAAFKEEGENAFSTPLKLSTDQNAYEPVVIATNNHRFVFAWEENGHIYLRLVHKRNAGPITRLSAKDATQPTLVQHLNGQLFIAFTQRQDRYRQVVVASLQLHDMKLDVGEPRPIDDSPIQGDQLYPSLVATRMGLVAAWEDRRHGHTRIFTSHSRDSRLFTVPRQINELLPPRSTEYGRGTGATRVMLASDLNRKVGAVWMDKRDFQGGYDVYAAFSTDGGKTFGSNEIAQDMLGENLPQWHPAITISRTGQVVVAWDDPRDDSPDIWLSLRTPSGWSDDESLEMASGEGAQTHPVMIFDQQGMLHIAWVHRSSNAAGTELRSATINFTAP